MAYLPDINETGPAYTQFKATKELVDRFNRGELDHLPKKELEQIAMMAAQFNIKFNTPSKPFKKGLFDFANAATLGLTSAVLDRPKSIGEEWHGESQKDKFWGTVGMIGGVGLPVAGAVKGVKYGTQGVKNLWNMAGNKVGNLNPFRDRVFNNPFSRKITDPSRIIGPTPLPNIGQTSFRGPFGQGSVYNTMSTPYNIRAI